MPLLIDKNKLSHLKVSYKLIVCLRKDRERLGLNRETKDHGI